MQKIHNFDILYHPQNVNSIITDGTDKKMVDYVREANKDHLDDTAMLYMDMRISYRELFGAIDLHARALKAFGIEKGDCVVICLPNTPESVYFIYACNEVGAIAYLIDPRYTLGKIKKVLNISDSKLFICEENTYFTKVAERVTALDNIETVIISPVASFFDCNKRINIKQWFIREIISNTRKKDVSDGLQCIKYSHFLENGKQFNDTISSEYDSDSTAIIINTSGTSGDSVKGAELQDRAYNILARTETSL